MTIIGSEVAAVIDGSNYEARPRCTVLRAFVEDYLENNGTFENVDTVVAYAASHAKLHPTVCPSSHLSLD